MTREKSVKLKCDCGHVMGARVANTLNQMRSTSKWKCHKCGKKYIVKISILEVKIKKMIKNA